VGWLKKKGQGWVWKIKKKKRVLTNQQEKGGKKKRFAGQDKKNFPVERNKGKKKGG